MCQYELSSMFWHRPIFPLRRTGRTHMKKTFPGGLSVVAKNLPTSTCFAGTRIPPPISSAINRTSISQIARYPDPLERDVAYLCCAEAVRAATRDQQQRLNGVAGRVADQLLEHGRRTSVNFALDTEASVAQEVDAVRRAESHLALVSDFE